MSNETMTVYEAINEVSRRVGSLAKEGFNSHQKYNFRGIDQLVTAVQPILNEVGLVILPRVISFNSVDRQTDKNTQRWCTVEVRYTLFGPNGDHVDTIMVGEAADVADKAMNKALSNAAKYFYFQTFWFGVGGMDDGDFDHPVANNVPQPQPQPRSQQQATSSRPSAGAATVGGDVTEPQRKKIWAMAHKSLNWDDAKMIQQIQIATGQDNIMAIEQLSKAQASRVIEDFQNHIDSNLNDDGDF